MRIRGWVAAAAVAFVLGTGAGLLIHVGRSRQEERILERAKQEAARIREDVERERRRLLEEIRSAKRKMEDYRREPVPLTDAGIKPV